MTLREFLKEVGVDVIEDTQGTLDLNMKLFAEDTVFDIDKVEIDYGKETISLRLLDLD